MPMIRSGLFVLAMAATAAATSLQPPAATPRTVTIDTPMPAPAWATLERQLLAENVPACREFYREVLR